jgi:hypothetical protein
VGAGERGTTVSDVIHPWRRGFGVVMAVGGHEALMLARVPAGPRGHHQGSSQFQQARAGGAPVVAAGELEPRGRIEHVGALLQLPAVHTFDHPPAG